jgi:hypothetical protein
MTGGRHVRTHQDGRACPRDGPWPVHLMDTRRARITTLTAVDGASASAIRITRVSVNLASLLRRPKPLGFPRLQRGHVPEERPALIRIAACIGATRVRPAINASSPPMMRISGRS